MEGYLDMKKFCHLSAVLVALMAILSTGCSTTGNPLARKTSVVEYYRIFDIQTSAGKQAVAKAASIGLSRNVNNATEANPIPTGAELPEKPGRFKLINPLAGTPMAAMVALSGGGAIDFKIAVCEGAAWSAKARRQIAGSNRLDITLCLFQYAKGYHLDMYGMFVKEEGGLMQISRNMAAAMVGTPEEWTEKTFLDVVRSIKAVTGADVTLLEAQPEIVGTPWLDAGEAIVK
jgi:hypothetical protein